MFHAGGFCERVARREWLAELHDACLPPADAALQVGGARAAGVARGAGADASALLARGLPLRHAAAHRPAADVDLRHHVQRPGLALACSAASRPDCHLPYAPVPGLRILGTRAGVDTNATSSGRVACIRKQLCRGVHCSYRL